jgi:hypothetical protein
MMELIRLKYRFRQKRMHRARVSGRNSETFNRACVLQEQRAQASNGGSLSSERRGVKHRFTFFVDDD